MLAFSMLALVMGSCTDEYEHSGATAEGEQVYFKTSLATKYDLDLTKNNFQVEINRINSAGELTVNLTATQKQGSIFTVPATVTFADGQTSANVTISYDPNVLGSTNYGYGYYEDITLSVNGEMIETPYGESSFKFSAGLTEWVDTDKKVQYRDDLISSGFGVDVMIYDVKLQKSSLKEGRYRLVNPYGEETPLWDMFVNTTLQLNNDHGLIFDISDPNYVYCEGIINPGLFNNQQLIFFSQSTWAIQTQGATLEDLKQSQDADVFFGKYKDGIVTMEKNAFIGGMGDGTIAGTQTAVLSKGNFAIAMPGYEIADFSSKFTYTGRFTDVSNKEYAQGTITLGEDVAAARWVLAADGDDINFIIDGIKNGSIESNYITANEDVKIQMSESGKYTVVIVTYDEKGEAKSSSATTFTFTLSAEVEEADWQPVFVGNFRYNVHPNFVAGPDGQPVGSLFQEGQHEAVLYQDANNPIKWKVEPYGALETNALYFDMDTNNGIATYADVETGFTTQAEGMAYVGDFNTLMQGNEPSSGALEDGVQFANCYYFLNNGERAWIGGAFEYFDIVAEANANSYMVKNIQNKHIAMMKAKNTKPVKRTVTLKKCKVKFLKVK